MMREFARSSYFLIFLLLFSSWRINPSRQSTHSSSSYSSSSSCLTAESLVIVCGGTGYIGSEVVKVLNSAGVETLSLSRKDRGDYKNQLNRNVEASEGVQRCCAAL